MVGLVIVSHSARLAEGVVELAREMAGPETAIEAAGGLDEPGDPIGTDAVRVMGAVARAAGDGGEVLVLMDLGSAVLSAETALDLLPDDLRARVLLCEAPLVEGAVAAAAAARAGAGLQEAAEEARRGLAGKEAHLGAGEGAPPSGPETPDGGGDWQTIAVTIADPHGLHARPAASVVRAVGALDAQVRIANATGGRGPASARSLTALATLGALHGHELRVEARGRDAAAALGAVRAALEEAAASGDEAPTPDALPAGRPPARAPGPGEALAGIPAAPGAGLGPARTPAGAAPAPREPGTPAQEAQALLDARATVGVDLAGARDLAARRAGADAAEIIDAQILLLDDEGLVGEAARAIEAGGGADRAWDDAVRRASAAYEGDEYLRARGADLREVGRRVVGRLAGPAARTTGAGVMVVEELGAADAVALDPGRVAAIASAGGGPTSHAAIMARALGIPYAAALGPGLLAIAEGTPLLVDGGAGTVLVAPDAEAVAAHEAAREVAAARRERARARAHEPAVTPDGRRVEVAANAGAPGDVAEAVAAGADGIGLLRSEFLFLGRREAPGEEEQVAAYAEAAATLGGRRLVLRTLDAGADKPLPYLARPPEENPFLGVRGLRMSLLLPDLLTVQLRAALRVAAVHPLSLMFPMVSEVAELRRALALLEAARASLAAEGVAAGEPEVGVMIEVPAAALAVQSLAELVGFLSIGTNDLVQYTMAAERGNGGVAHLSDPVHPVILRLIDAIVRRAKPHGCRVAVCGEAASDAAAIPLLVGLGLDELSVAPPLVPEVKEAVRRLERPAARDLASRAMEREDAPAVRALVAAEASSGPTAAGG